MRRVVRSRADLEALEVALRLTGATGPEHILVRKTKVLVMLAESFPDYDRLFINRDQSSLRAFSALTLSAFRTAYKAAKGMTLLRVHGRG